MRTNKRDLRNKRDIRLVLVEPNGETYRALFVDDQHNPLSDNTYGNGTVKIYPFAISPQFYEKLEDYGFTKDGGPNKLCGPVWVLDKLFGCDAYTPDCVKRS